MPLASAKNTQPPRGRFFCNAWGKYLDNPSLLNQIILKLGQTLFEIFQALGIGLMIDTKNHLSKLSASVTQPF